MTSTPKYKSSLLKYLINIEVELRNDYEQLINKFEDIVQKIKYLVKNLHKLNLTHTDLSFFNICIDDNDELHLIDFEGLFNDDIYNNISYLSELEAEIKYFMICNYPIYQVLINDVPRDDIYKLIYLVSDIDWNIL